MLTAGGGNTKPGFWQRHRDKLIDAGAAFSLANLCFVNIWSEQLNPAGVDFFHKVPPAHGYLQITTANILVVGALIFIAIAVTRRLKGVPRLVAELLFLGLLLVPLNIIRTRFLFIGLGVHSWKTSMAVAGVLIGASALLHWRKPVIRFARLGLLILLPFLPLAYVEAIVQQSSTVSAEEFTRTLNYPRVHVGETKPIRVVWVIFDELDACMAFSRRSPDVQLPELDRLQSESVYATRATSPAANTVESIPSLFTGNLVERSRFESLDDLRLSYRNDHKYHLFSKEPNPFTRAHGLGFNTGLAGWFLPYCRLFPFNSCYWEPINSVFLRDDYARYLSFTQSMWFQLSGQMLEVPGLYAAHSSIGREAWTRLPKARRASREHSIREYQRIHEQAIGLLQDRSLDIVFLHWPTPHPLFYFDRKTGDFTTTDGPNYFDALALVDRTIKDIRTALEQSGNWNDTALLVSSDHPLRSYFLRESGYWTPEEKRAMGDQLCSYVPFLLKMPGQQSAVRYDHPMNTVVSGDLLLEVLKGDLVSPQAVAQWLDAHFRQMYCTKSAN